MRMTFPVLDNSSLFFDLYSETLIESEGYICKPRNGVEFHFFQLPMTCACVDCVTWWELLDDRFTNLRTCKSCIMCYLVQPLLIICFKTSYTFQIWLRFHSFVGLSLSCRPPIGLSCLLCSHIWKIWHAIHPRWNVLIISRCTSWCTRFSIAFHRSCLQRRSVDILIQSVTRVWSSILGGMG